MERKGQRGEPEPEEGLPSLKSQAARDQEGLWREVLGLANYVDTALRASIEVLCRGRIDLIDAVRAEEEEIDRWEVRIESECLRVLALYGLAASDLRRVVGALRVNRELEELADVGENLAKRAKKIVRDPCAAPFLVKLTALADASLAVVEAALKALRAVDADLARRVVLADDTVDSLRLTLLAELKDAVRSDPGRVNSWLRLISSARNLERAADHATHIAEAVIYIKEGAVVRRGDRIAETDA